MNRAKIGIKECPGLTLGDRPSFRDSMGRTHDLITERTYSLKEAAPMFGCGRSVLWLRRQIKAGNVYPTIVYSNKSVEVFACAVTDWKARMLNACRKGAA